MKTTKDLDVCSLYKNTKYTKKEISDKKEKTSLLNYGVSHPMKSDDVKAHLKEVFLEKYNVDNPSKSKLVKAKMKETFLKTYGVDNPSKNQEVIDKIIKDAKLRWADPVKKDQMLEKRRKTNLEKYGVEYNSQRAEHKIMVNATSMINHGTKWPMQNEIIMTKSLKNSKNFKDYTLPSGRIIKIQGYEHHALNNLLNIYDETDICVDRICRPSINYIFDNENRKYKPDFYIKSRNLIIEVKSTFTYKKELEKNIAKRSASIEAGYGFQFMVFDGKGNEIDI